MASRVLKKSNKVQVSLEEIRMPVDYLKSHFLMAMPALLDVNFRQSVTCISEHNEDGAMGIVINQRYDDLNAKMIFEELGIAFSEDAMTIPIHIGGPVHTNELFVLHEPPLDWGGSLIITDHLALSNSRDILEAIAAKNGPQNYIISLGCAGWAPGQLEWEVSQNAWLVTPCSHEIIFEVPVDARWKRAIQNLGIDPEQLSDAAGRA
jgi:putative transcriptional regulator